MIRHEAIPSFEKKKILEAIKRGDAVNFIPDYIENMPKVNLTLAGKIRFLGYPEEAVKLAIDKIMATNHCPNPLQAYQNFLSNWCRINNVLQDGYWVKLLTEAYKIFEFQPSEKEPERKFSTEVYFGNVKYRLLSTEETNARRADFISRPGFDKSIANLAGVMKPTDQRTAMQLAQEYFEKVFENLKYQELYPKSYPEREAKMTDVY